MIEHPSTPPLMTDNNIFDLQSDSDLPLHITAPPEPTAPRTRKRDRKQVTFSDSSELPLFSSDAPLPSVEDYSAGSKRQKRQAKRRWWGNEPQSRVRLAEKEQRKSIFDSAIWMGDSDEEYSVEEYFTGPPVLAYTPTEQRRAFAASRPLTRQQAAVRVEIQELVDRNWKGELSNKDGKRGKYLTEDVNEHIIDIRPTIFENGLDDLPNELLKPLHTLLGWKRRDFAKASKHFRHTDPSIFEPKINIKIQSSDVESLPTELFRLKHLSTLQIDSGCLTEISADVAALPKLRLLEVSRNHLRYLPFEILKTDCVIRAFENPFVAALSSTGERLLSCIRHIHGELFLQSLRPIHKARPKTRLCARSKLIYLDQFGRPEAGGEIPLSGDRATTRELLAPVLRNFDKRVPSLFELALLKSAQVYDHEYLRSSEDSPPLVRAAFEKIIPASTPQAQKCSICHQDYLYPRVEWLEWYTGSTEEAHHMLPYIRRSCSATCRPRRSKGIPEEWLACSWMEDRDHYNVGSRQDPANCGVCTMLNDEREREWKTRGERTRLASYLTWAAARYEELRAQSKPTG